MTVLGGSVRLADPWALLALVVLAAVLGWTVRRDRAGTGGVLFPSLRLVPAAGASWRTRYRWVLLPLRTLAIVLVVVALARPQVALAGIGTDAEGIDIALALDTSSSMLARDFGGAGRIDGAKRVMRTFVSGLQNDRVGVVLFSGEALQLSPLTLDYAATDKLIEPIQAGRLIRDGTAIGVGMATAINVLRDSKAISKVIILFTDGENNSGEITPIDAAEIAKVLGIRVYTVGLSGGSGEVDEKAMREISERTGASYFRASNEAALLTVYRDISRLEKSRVGRREPAGYEDIYLLVLLPAAALLALELVLASTIFRRSP